MKGKLEVKDQKDWFIQDNETYETYPILNMEFIDKLTMENICNSFEFEIVKPCHISKGLEEDVNCPCMQFEGNSCIEYAKLTSPKQEETITWDEIYLEYRKYLVKAENYIPYSLYLKEFYLPPQKIKK